MDDIQEQFRNKRLLDDESTSHQNGSLFSRETVQVSSDDSTELHEDESLEAVYESLSTVKVSKRAEWSKRGSILYR